MRIVNQQQVLIRRQVQKSIGLIQLPDEYMMGRSGNANDTKYRFAEVVSAPEHIPQNSQVVVHECQSQALEVVGDKVHRVPLEFVLGYKDDTGFHCLQNVVMVKPDPKEETVSGSFILAPESSRPPVTKGTITQIGPDCKYLEVGQRIMYALFAGLEVELEGEVFLLLREMSLTDQWVDEVIGVLESE